MPTIHNNALDDESVDAMAEGFTGVDMSTKSTRLPAGRAQLGLNMWADLDTILKGRPAFRFVSLLNTSPGAGPHRVQGMDYYDTPGYEAILAVREGKLYEMTGAGNSQPNSHLAGPTYSTTAQVTFSQLVDRMFGCDGTIRWHIYNAGWTHGTVTQFSDTTAMPTWRLICAHQFRMIAVDADGNRLYVSAVGQAHNSADWVKTDTLRVGSGEGDPITSVISAQGGRLIVVCERSAWQVDTNNVSVANWTVTRITGLTGCVARRTAVAFGQDLLFLSRYGVTSLGALQAADSINPQNTFSAPIQPIIDRINWAAVDTAWGTAWRDLYLLALPLDGNTQPKHLIGFHTRTGSWTTPWQAALPSQEVATGPTVTATFDGFTAACVTRFAVKQETLIADSCGRILRIDDSAETDESAADASHAIEQYVTLRAFDFDVPKHWKQPFWTEVEFYRSTASDVQISLVRDGLQAYPDKALAECECIAEGLVTGQLTTWPLVFPIVFQANETYRRPYHIRHFPRFREAAIQVHAAQGRLALRSVVLSAFIDTPTLT